VSLTTDQEGHFQPGQNVMQSIQVITSVSSHVRIEKKQRNMASFWWCVDGIKIGLVVRREFKRFLLELLT